MTTKDRILCAFGFHGKLERDGVITSVWCDDMKPRITGQILRCPVCGRLLKWLGVK